MKKRFNSFIEYLEAHYYKQINKEVERFFSNHKNILTNSKYSINNVSNVEIDNLVFKNVSIDDKENDHIEFDIVIISDLTIVETKIKENELCSKKLENISLNVTCCGKVEKKLTDFKILQVEEYNKLKPKRSFDGNFLPVISAKNYSQYAEKFLKEYCPEFPEVASKLDVDEFARKMGLKVIKRSINKEHSIIGQIYFEDTSNKLYNDELGDYEQAYIEKDTMIVDEVTSFKYSNGSYNFTVIHECIHSKLHRKAFKLAQMINNDLELIECEFQDSIPNEVSSIKWMEIQANGITPFILVPSKALEIKLKELLEKYSDNPEFTEKIVDEVSEFFGVSIYISRKRLIEIGYENVIGVYNWVDNHYVPSYFYKKGALKSNETFIISFNDIINEDSNKKLFELLDYGNFVFVENHLCLNNNKFCFINEEGDLKLTEYARYHLDECCLVFKYKSTNLLNNNLSNELYLCREPEVKSVFELEFIQEVDEFKPIEETKKHIDELFSINKSISFMKVSEIIRFFLNHYDMQVKDLEISSGLSDRTIARYLNDKNKNPQKRVLIAICCGLHVPSVFSEVILSQAGIKLTNNNKDDFILSFVLRTMYNSSPKQINDYLSECGYEPLTKNFLKK